MLKPIVNLNFSSRKLNLAFRYTLIFLFVTYVNVFAQNNCLDFDGDNDYVSVSLPTVFSDIPNNDFTIEFWAKFDDLGDYATWIRILEAYYDANNGVQLQVGDDQIMGQDGVIQVYLKDGGTSRAVSTNKPLQTSYWYHIAMSWDASADNLKLYLNGVEQTQAGLTSGVGDGSTQALHIGQMTDGTGHFDGQLDEIRIWDETRIQDSIRNNMYQEVSTSSSNLVAYYKLNETSGSTADNAQGSSTYDGTLNNMDNSDWITSPAFAGSKNCLEFDGINDYVNCGNAGDHNSSNVISIEAWVYLNSETNDYDRILFRSGNDGQLTLSYCSYALCFNNETKPRFCVNGYSVIAPSAISLGEWHHIAGTFNRYEASDDLKLYVDGELVNTRDYSGSVPSHNVYDIILGASHSSAYGSDYFLDGRLDEVRLWESTRTAEEIRENMCKILVGDESNLAFYWRFNQTYGNILPDWDDKGTGGEGTLCNMNDDDWITSTAFNTWLNTNSSSWSTSANWSRGSVPGSSDNVDIYSYSGGTDAILSGTPTVFTFVLGGSSSMTLSSGVTVNGNLILESDLDLSGQTITLGSTGTLIEDNGVLFGSSGTITTTRTLSDIDEDVAGLGAQITTSQNMGSTVVTRGVTAQTGGGNSGIKRYYNISPTNNSGLNATLVLNYFESELNGITEGELELYRSTDDGSTWISYGGTVNTSSNTITITGIDAFSRWTAGDKNNPLPVGLSSFTAACSKGTVILKWTTEFEINNSGFDIERKKKEVDKWMKIGFVEGHGTVNTPQSYVFIDKNLTAGKYNYRLKQFDNNGNYKYFFLYSDVFVKAPSKFNVIQNYPNPFNPKTNICFELPGDSKVSIVIYDMLGRELSKLVDGFYEAGYHSVEFDGSFLSSGMYFYKIETEESEAVKSMLLIK